MALFMDMRLGKTLIAIRWLKTRPNCKLKMIVAPLAVIPTWTRELALEGVTDVAVLTGTAKQRQQMLESGLHFGCEWFIINYEGLTESGHKTVGGRRSVTPSAYAEIAWDAVLLDESTRIRVPKSAISMIAQRELADARFKAILSGLPDPEGCEDFVPQFCFLNGEFMGHNDFWSWRQEHMQETGSGGWETKWKSRALTRQEANARSFTMTRQQAGISTPKIRCERRVVLPRKVTAAIEEAFKNFEVGDKMTKTSLTALTWACQLAGGRWPHDDALHHNEKVKEVVRLTSGELKRDSIVVWCRHTAELLAVTEALSKAQIKVEGLYGEVKQAARQEMIDRFMAKRTRVLVAQPKCCHVGIDLSVADTAIYYSNWWDEEIRAQSEDRIIHPKKQRPVLLIDIVAEGTPDEDIFDALSEKDVEARAFMRPFMARAQKRARRIKEAT